MLQTISKEYLIERILPGRFKITRLENDTLVTYVCLFLRNRHDDNLSGA